MGVGPGGGREHGPRPYLLLLQVDLHPANALHQLLALLLQKLGVEVRGLSGYGLSGFVELGEGELEVLYLLVVLEDEDVVLLGDGLDGALGLVGLLVVGVDDFEVAGESCQVLLVDLVELPQQFLLLGGDSGPQDVELPSDRVLLATVPFVGVLNHAQEALLQLGHVGLRLPHSGGDIQVLALDLRDGFLYQFDLVVLVGSFLSKGVPWIAHSGQMLTQHEKQ